MFAKREITKDILATMRMEKSVVALISTGTPAKMVRGKKVVLVRQRVLALRELALLGAHTTPASATPAIVLCTSAMTVVGSKVQPVPNVVANIPTATALLRMERSFAKTQAVFVVKNL